MFSLDIGRAPRLVCVFVFVCERERGEVGKVGICD